ncbi:MAG: hypothetical protein R6V85_19415 [Polyangia bacterium]
MDHRETVTLSIKKVPGTLKRRLTRRAAAAHRSLNGELLHILESAVAEARPDEEEIEERLERLKAVREAIGGPGMTDEQVEAAIAEGRP